MFICGFTRGPSVVVEGLDASEQQTPQMTALQYLRVQGLGLRVLGIGVAGFRV